MKTKNISWFLFIGIFLIHFSCTKDFEEINKNPNAGTEANDIFYLTKVIIQTAYDYQKASYRDEPSAAGRYITRLRNASADNFGWAAKSWDDQYKILSTNQTLYDQATAGGRDQYVALSLIMEVFNFANITETWGDCPYTEALKSKSDMIIYPKYDKQQDIYPDLLKKLEQANTLLQNTSLTIDAGADALYGGDKLKWRKFANSLRLRMLLRSAKKISTAYSDIQAIVNNPTQYPIFTSNADDAEIPYVNTHKWPGGPTGGGGTLDDEYAEFIKRRPSKEIIDFMQSRNDPRLSILFEPVKLAPEANTQDKNAYVGVPISLHSPYDYNGGGDHISILNRSIFYKDYPTDSKDFMVKASLITYAEVCFILAEVAQQNGVTVPGETAESLYKKGISTTLNYWRVTDQQVIDNYLAESAVVYDGTLKQLIGQKWAALFIRGYEGWFDCRRTNDILEFEKSFIQENLSQRTVPLRYIYPDGERSNNKEQYDAALKVFGADDRNTKMWLLQ